MNELLTGAVTGILFGFLMQKAQVIKYVDKKWGFDTNDDNLADAYVLARVAAAGI